MRASADVRVFRTPDELAGALADFFVQRAREAITARDAFHVALAGGTTPKSAYALLAESPLRDNIEWAKVHVYFSDERCVPPQSEESNFKTADDVFLSRVSIPREHIYRMRGEEYPLEAARAYAELVSENLGQVPLFDLIMLGMGADGHTASLFPGTDPLIDTDLLVRAPYVEKMKTYRLTFTPRVINNSRHAVIATEGSAKAAALHAALEGPHDPIVYPVQIVAPATGSLTWLADAAAAAELS